MSKRMSYAEIGSSNSYGDNYRQAVKPFRPSKFLNDFESIPTKINTEREQDEEVIDYMYPKTARRRVALGNYKSQSNNEAQISLPTLQNLSLHSNPQSTPQKFQAELKKSTILRTEEDQQSELKNINKKIRQIINSNKRQVTFQSSLIVIDEQNQAQVVQKQQLKEILNRRKTIVRHKTLNA